MMDFVTLRVHDNKMQLLLLRRNMEDRPHYGEFALVGGMIYSQDKEGGLQRDEDYESARDRIIRTKLGVIPTLFREVYNDGSAKRDAAGWSVVAVHYAFVNPDLSETITRNPDYKWVNLDDVLSGRIQLPFDHNQSVERVVAHIRNMFGYTSGALYSLPYKFTIAQIVNVYSLLGIEVSRQSIRQRLIGGGHIKELQGDFEVKRGKPTPYYIIAEQEMSFFDSVIGKRK
ncbi:NUDIX domain-containing protein [Vibrio coralliirubri]|uniref:NUDIX domain-containing protein n=1 Tax=Vibrio coralliirubri TaxID=1516159 RepID=UPI00228388F8|nr:NUDIX hydrolase [Vibrio coralliirubri]